MAEPASQLGGQSRPAVAFLGPVASYTHQAAQSAFPGPEWELSPVATIKDVFEAVREGSAAYGVVPFENSTHGPVTFTLAGLADREGRYGELFVCGETYLAVHHYLLGRKRPGRRPGTTNDTDADAEEQQPGGVPLDAAAASLGHIARLYSHPQAFGQTAAFVRRHLRPGVETIDASSTSRAAELAAADASGASAAISSQMAARHVGLDVLAARIEDRADNTTRFYVLKGAAAAPTAGSVAAPIFPAAATGPAGPTKSLVSFTVPHRSPGALAAVLDCFRRGGLNLTSINSVPGLRRPFQYLFFVEFEHDDEEDPQKESGWRRDEERDEVAEERVQRVLAEVAKVAETWRLLGTWAKPDEGAVAES